MIRSYLTGAASAVVLCACFVVVTGGTATAVNFEWDGDAEAISGLNTWDAIEAPAGFVTNWSPENFPTAADNIILTGASLAGPVTIDLNGPRQVNAIHVNGVDGAYTFENTGSGALEIFLAAGTALFNATAQSTLIIDADIEFQSASLLRFNGNPAGGRIIVNGDITTAAASGTTTLELTSRNNGLTEAIQIHGVISDGDGSTAVMALIAGFAGDADQHRAEVVLTGENTYTGPTDVNGATLTFTSIANVGGARNALGQPLLADSVINIGINAGGGSAPGTLKYTGSGHASDRVINLAGTSQGGIINASGTGALVLSGGITATTNGSKTLTLTGDNTDENTISGVITDVSGGDVHITKSGAGTWVLTGANQAAGNHNINDGELILRGTGSRISALGAFVNTLLRVNNDATFTLEGGTVTAREMDVAVGATFNFKSGTVNLSAATSTFNTGLVVVGTDGAGTLNLNGTAAQFNNGVAVLGSDDTLNLTAGSLTTTDLVNFGGGTFNFAGGSVAITGGQITTGAGSFNGGVSGSGGITKIGAGTLTLNKNNSYTGSTNINQGTLKLGTDPLDSFSASTAVTVASGATLDLVGSNGEAFGGLAGGGAVITGAGADVVPGQNNQNTTFSGTISGTGNLTKTGTGILTLTGNNTYSGGFTTVNAAGTLKLGAGNTLPDLTQVKLDNSGAKLDLDNANEEIGGLSGFAGSQVLLGTATLTTGSNNKTLNFDGNIMGTGGLTKVGNGTQRLRATNTFTGDINVNDGTLTIGIGNTIGNNAVIVASGATLRVEDPEAFGSLAGAGTVISVDNTGVGVNPGFNNTSTTFSGNITGAGLFIKSGTGTMTMTGLSNYTGLTRVDNGSLVFDGASAGLTATNSITLNGGDATIKNNATINTPGPINLETTTSSLLIESGGVVTSFQTNIGLSSGADSSATVTGVGSRMQNSSRTRVGNNGKGTLNVLNGGQVIVGERLAIADSAAGSANSTAIIDGFINNGTNGIFGDDDDEVSLVNAAFAVFVGDAATGFLTIQNGGRLVSGTGSNNHTTNFSIIGTVAIADGSIATITGNQSRWVHNGFMEVARQGGDATNPVELNVLDGGFAEFSFLQSSTRDGSRSKITVDGANSTLHLRDARGDAGVVSPGFGDIRMVPSASNGFSEIFVTNGGLLDIDTVLAIGQGTADTAGQAHVTVDGTDSTIDVGKELSVGHTGSTGSLTITDGGTVNSGTSDAAVSPTRDSFISRTSGNGTANVGAVAAQDAGHAQASWNLEEDLFIAGSATGSNSAGVGTLNVNPTGQVAVTGLLRVWDRGIVNLNGGVLEVDSINLTDSTPGIVESPTFNFNSGTLRFTTTPEATLGAALLSQLLGNNPTLTAGQELAVNNTAILSAPLRNNGGTFTVGEIDAASAANLDFDAGTFNLTQADLTVGNAGIFGPTLIINPNQTINVTNLATVEAGAELAVFGGFNSGGLTNNGDLILADTTGSGKTINGALTTPVGSTVTVIGTINFADLVSGAGQFFGPGTANFLGGHNPGDSPAVIGFEGNASYPQTSTLFIELGGTTPGDDHDQLDIAQNVTLGGGTLDITLRNGFVPDYLDEFVVITAGTRSGEFDDFTGAFINPDMTLAPVYDYEGNIGLTLVAAIPGDANLDGIVNGLDLLSWQSNLFSGDQWVQGDFNLDGLVSGLDLLIWQSHLFNSVQGLGGGALAAAASVPEPGSALLLVCGGSLLAGLRRPTARRGAV